MQHKWISALASAAAVAFTALPASSNDVLIAPRLVFRFADLPATSSGPEGIARNPNNGEIIVSTFRFGGPNSLLRYNRFGTLLAELDFGAEPLTGLTYNAADDKIYLCNDGSLAGLGPSRIQRVEADFTAASTIEEVAVIPNIGAPPNRVVVNPDTSIDTISFGNFAAAPNALLFDAGGDLYVSDSFQGALFEIPAAASSCPGGGCSVNTVIHDGLLATAGVPPFGANGLAFSPTGDALFIANTGDDRVLRLELASNALSVFAESINGADGMVMASDGHLWIAANQADEVIALDGSGRIVARLGAFFGIEADGAAKGLLFPASLALSDNFIYVTNLAFPLTASAGDEPEEDVTTFTISILPRPNL